MRKVLLAVLVACMLSLVVAPVRLASADSDDVEPLLCTFDMSIDLASADPYWSGSISGDIVGTLEVRERWADNYIVGATEHFFEDNVITTDNGNLIGYDKGVWNFATFKFRAMGWVTEATDGMADLEGYKMIMRGFTSDFPPSPPNTIVTATGTLMLVPP